MLGPEHPETLTNVYHLAFLLHCVRRDDKASKLYDQARAGFEKALV